MARPRMWNRVEPSKGSVRRQTQVLRVAHESPPQSGELAMQKDAQPGRRGKWRWPKLRAWVRRERERERDEWKAENNNRIVAFPSSALMSRGTRLRGPDWAAGAACLLLNPCRLSRQSNLSNLSKPLRYHRRGAGGVLGACWGSNLIDGPSPI